MPVDRKAEYSQIERFVVEILESSIGMSITIKYRVVPVSDLKTRDSIWGRTNDRDSESESLGFPNHAEFDWKY